MQKINHLLNDTDDTKNDPFSHLVSQANKHLSLQQFWQEATPKIIGQSSFASNLSNGILVVFAYNNGVAAKIKLTSASLLTQLQNLQKTSADYQPYKVTGISVKVQVKYQQKQVTTTSRTLSVGAATTLRKLADNLGDSTLAQKLNKIADNA